MSSKRDVPTLIGLATSGQLTGYRVEIWPADIEGWDIFYFNPDLGVGEFNSYAEDWGTALAYGEQFGVRWCGGTEWAERNDSFD